MTKYAYSLDEERYHGEFDSIEQALAEVGQAAEDDAIEESEHTRTVWIGEVTTAANFLRRMNPLWFGDSILEQAEEYLSEHIGWDDYIVELAAGPREELGKVITEWLCKHAKFNAYGIRNAKEYTVKVGAA